jgi:hypothetical protein
LPDRNIAPAEREGCVRAAFSLSGEGDDKRRRLPIAYRRLPTEVAAIPSSRLVHVQRLFAPGQIQMRFT